MTTYLLDANVLIALTVQEHEHHAAASAWASGVGRFAVCPIVEGALVRFLVRAGETAEAARSVLAAVRDLPTCEFWPDEVSYLDVELGLVQGHRQVTDAYMVALSAFHEDAAIATFDAGLAQLWPTQSVLLGSMGTIG